MPATATVEVRATEFDQFKRVVEFVKEVQTYAREKGDENLEAKVDMLLDDLAEMQRRFTTTEPGGFESCETVLPDRSAAQ